eukprot:COSAG02_NODE_29107_length_576_cov_0.752621_1_plen_89_part_10
MNIANEQNSPLLIIGSDDGAVRVWRGTFDDQDQTEDSAQNQLRQWKQPELLTAWHALSGLRPAKCLDGHGVPHECGSAPWWHINFPNTL